MSPKVDVDAVPAAAFALAEDHAPFVGDWHQHARHQLLFSDAGTMELEVAGGRWLLPPHRAAWLRAGTPHRVESRGRLALRTVYLEADWTAGPAEDCLVLDVPPLAREMLLYAGRWGPGRDPEDPVAEAFFRCLAALVPEWCAGRRGLLLPVPEHPELQEVAAWVAGHLDEELGLEAAAAQVHVSPRTLKRRFAQELGMSFSEYLRRARLLRALELLAAPGAQVTAVGYEVGFRSPAAFSRAFRELVGEAPRDYLARMSSRRRPSRP